MNKKLIFIIIIISPTLIFAQHRLRMYSNDINRFRLKGKVKSLKYFEFNIKYLNDSVYKLTLEDFLVPRNYKVDFNQDGYITSKIEYRLKNDSIIEKGLWTYNYEKNKIKNEIYYWNNKSKDTTQWNYFYPDNQTTRINKISTMSPKLMHYNYRQLKNKEYYKSINSDSSYIRRSLFVYDNKNRIIRIEKYDDKHYTTDIILNTYSDSLNPNPKLTVSSYTKYDAPPVIRQYEFNNQYDITVRDGLNTKDDKMTIFEYKYDDEKNWIEKVEKGGTGKIIKIYKRKIEYY